jgi:hypothetical protein
VSRRSRLFKGDEDEGSPEMNPIEDPEKERIRRVIRANIGQIRSCYESELKTKPTLAGKIQVRFIIDPAGDVAQVLDAEGSTLEEPQLFECIRAQVRNWKFPIPKSAGCVVVTYPFMFRPSGK